MALALGLALVGVCLAVAAPTTTIRPAVGGAFKIGEKLTVDRGTWAGSGTLSYAFQWYRCDAAGAKCKAIRGATEDTFTTTAADGGKTLGVTVKATDSTGAANAYSSLAGPIANGLVFATAPPKVTGGAEVGQELKADAGSWSTTPQSTTYAWLRCNGNGRICAAIKGATAASYKPVADDVGHALVARVTAKVGSTVQAVWSSATTPVAAEGSGLPSGATPLGDKKYSIPVESVALPARLVVAGTTLQPPAALTVRVLDSRGYAVRGALVRVTAPYGWVAPLKETATGNDGTVVFQLQPKAGHPRPVVLFVRARKPGDDVLAGVTGTRLVSVRLST